MKDFRPKNFHINVTKSDKILSKPDYIVAPQILQFKKWHVPSNLIPFGVAGFERKEDPPRDSYSVPRDSISATRESRYLEIKCVLYLRISVSNLRMEQIHNSATIFFSKYIYNIFSLEERFLNQSPLVILNLIS